MKLKAPPKDYRQSLNIKGAVYVRQTRWGLVAQKWPRKRGVGKTPYDKFRQAEFAWVAHQASQPLPVEYDTAVALTKDTLLMPRDLLMMAMYGSALEFSLPDGTILPRFRDVTNNPQYVLDQVTDEVGAMLYRSEEGWIWVNPGNDGSVLFIKDRSPFWGSLPFANGGPTSQRQIAGETASSSAFATKGNRINLTEQLFLDQVQAKIATSAGKNYILNVGKYVGTAVTEFLIDPITIVPSTSANAVLTFNLPEVVQFDAGTDYFISITRDDITGSTSNGVYALNAASFGLPLTQGTDQAIRSTAKPFQVGSTLDFAAVNTGGFALSERFTY
jgi:hypothetical protein